jgi:hypothetical protein
MHPRETGRQYDAVAAQVDAEWRVIYRVVADALLIQVIQVTPHDYRRP